ncbi:MAG: hypothetical protein IT395_01395, partial [Candidatus Omnitrophica bacterium]|nr:hypothetical protein [Candidatus Omnitrophota bacterium]
MTNPEKTFPFSSLLVASFFPAVLLLLVCLVTYLPTIFNGFKLDDFTYLNPDMHQRATSFWGLFTESTNQHYNPLNIFFNDLFFPWWGKNVVPFHLLNLSLFYINVLLLYRTCFLITSRKFTALLAAILFCVHPINAEIVNQVVFNTVLIAAALVQLSFLAFDRYLQTHAKRYYLLSLIYAAVSFLTLETSWLLPAYLLMWAMRDRSFKQSLRLTLPFWAMTIFLLVIWYQLSQGNTVTGGFVQKFAYLNLSFLTLAGSWAYLFFWYLQKLFIPVDHIWIYAVSPLTVSEAVKYLALTAAAASAVIFFRKTFFHRPILTAALWFFSGFVF